MEKQRAYELAKIISDAGIPVKIRMRSSVYPYNKGFTSSGSILPDEGHFRSWGDLADYLYAFYLGLLAGSKK
jgi:hypothetical protein